MNPPAWNDPGLKGGTMIRAALWLKQVIGEGNTFTKEQVRQAFPGVSQADRRVRDLRDYQWSILANNEDASLLAEEQRFVRAGVPVWDPAARRAAAPQNSMSAKEKQEVFRRDDYMCTVCGISGGEPYPDDVTQSGVLSVSRREATAVDGSQREMLVTECKRCRAGRGGVQAKAGDVVVAIESLEDSERRRLIRWIARGRRSATPLDRAWSAYRQLPADARDEVRSRFGA